MKHINLGHWDYVTEPFSKFQTSLCFGRNKRDRAFVPSKVEPDAKGILLSGGFKVIKNMKGTIMIVPGVDVSNKILLFGGVEGGFRGGVYKLKSTSALIISEAIAASKCESAYNFAALLKADEVVDIRSYGRYFDNVHRYRNIDGELKIETMTKT